MAGQGAADGTPFGRYRLIELLGRGGMGEVWRAHDTDTDRIVAIKVLPAHFSENEDFQRRFRREAHAAARLNSPHVIPIHYYGEIDGRLYVDMRLIEGRDLQAVLVDGPLEPLRAIRIIEQVALALNAAHKVGLLHRDVKPSNILLDENDFAYLIDFGIARAADETRLTKSGNTIGTFQYIAPERLGTRAEEDARADIYSLACVLYECLTGHPPFADDSIAQLVAAHLNTPPPRPSASEPNVPEQIDQVIATGMAKDPDQRYASTMDLARAARDATTVPLASPVPSAPAQRPIPPHHLVADPIHDQDARLAATGAPPGWRPPPGPPGPPPLWVQPTPKRPGGPRRNRTRWIIGSSAAAAALVIVAVVAAIVGLRPGPTPTRAPTQPTTSPTPPATSQPPPHAPMVAPDQLDSILLGVADVNTMMGASGMQPNGGIDHAAWGSNVTLSNPDCLGAFSASIDVVYQGSGYTEVSGEELLEPGNSHAHDVEQAVVRFPSADLAQAFVKTSLGKWGACAGQTITDTFNGQTFRWTFDKPVGDAPAITQLSTQEGANGWGCQHALRAVLNVVIDVNACGRQISDQAGQMADKMAATATQQAR